MLSKNTYHFSLKKILGSLISLTYKKTYENLTTNLGKILRSLQNFAPVYLTTPAISTHTFSFTLLLKILQSGCCKEQASFEHINRLPERNFITVIFCLIFTTMKHLLTSCNCTGNCTAIDQHID